MANLIPPTARKMIKVEYWLRTISVWMFLLSTALLIFAVLQLPTYILIKGQLESFELWHKEASSENEKFKASEQKIRQANQVGVLLRESKDQVLFSDIKREVESVASDEIVIERYSMSRAEGVVKSFTVAGEALSRAALANFKNDLENHEMFTTVDLPLSNLAKDVDIPFSVVVTLDNPEETS